MTFDSHRHRSDRSGKFGFYWNFLVSDMIATIVWDDNLSPVYAFWGGGAQQLADTNVVFRITTPSDDITGARYMEVTDDPNPQLVLKIEITQQNAYRLFI